MLGFILMQSELEVSIKNSIFSIPLDEELPAEQIEEPLEWISDSTIAEENLDTSTIDYSLDESIIFSENTLIVDYIKLFYGQEEDSRYVLTSEEEILENAEYENYQHKEEAFEEIQLAAVTSSTYMVNQEKMKEIDIMFKLDYGRFVVLSIGSLTNDINYSPL